MLPAEIPADLVPRWERRHHGRFRWELDALSKTGVAPTIDGEALSKGILILDFSWQVGSAEIQLRATYPDGFPRLRPAVQLRGDPATFPRRHCSPTDGTLCLLGRDTAQWLPEMTLADLLTEQLENALNGSGDEDPQGEPTEVWWNHVAVPNSFCLVETGWSIGDSQSGMLEVRYHLSECRDFPAIRAAVIEVRDLQREVIATSTSVPPAYLDRAAVVPWVRVAASDIRAGDGEGLVAFLESNEFLRHRRVPLPAGQYHLQLFGLAYESELQWEQTGLSWLFPIIRTRRRGSSRKGIGNCRPGYSVIRTLRAGPTDLGARVPAVALLREKRIAVFGPGAVGGPLVVELAKNGCRRVHVVEHDVVEPGQSVRWVLGASAWGRGKLEALRTFIASEYPWTEVVTHEHHVGAPGDGTRKGDDEVLSAVLGDVDLVIDGTASYGVTTLLSDYCREWGVPLIELFATPSVEGGIVARYAPDDGCPVCLLHAWNTGNIRTPPGLGNDLGLQQPPGCAERTFTGASYDLQELSLQAVRLAVQTLQNPEAARKSVVHTLALVDDEGRTIPPRWDVYPLPPHPDCACKRG